MRSTIHDSNARLGSNSRGRTLLKDLDPLQDKQRITTTRFHTKYENKLCSNKARERLLKETNVLENTGIKQKPGKKKA